MTLTLLQSEIQEEIQKYKGLFAYVISIDDEQIEFNSQGIFSSASTIKIPLLLEAFRQIEYGKLDLEQAISIRREKIVSGAGILQALTLEKLPLRDLLTLMIIVSDNTATNLVIDALQIRFPYRFHEIGLTKSSLQRKMMDLDNIRMGIDNWVCAADLQSCLHAIQNSTFYSRNSRTLMMNMLEMQQLKKKLPFYINENLIKVANKTGELPGTEHDCAILKYGNRTATVTVLCSGLEQNRDGQELIQDIGKRLNGYLLSL